MKKTLFTLAFACLGLTISSSAQVIMTQNFESPTVTPALPTNWSQGSTGTPGWFTSTNAGTGWGSLTGYYNIPAHTQYAVVDDAANPPNLHDTLKSPVFSLAGTANDWMNYDYFFFNAELTDQNGNATNIETCHILGSSDGGTTWAIIDSVFGNGFDGTDTWATAHVNLSSLSGANCRIAFVYSDDGANILGCALDNIQILSLPAEDVTLNAIGYNNIAAGVSTNGATLAFQVTNNGGTVSSLTMYYNINNGAPVAQTFTGLNIDPYTSQVLSFTTPFAGAVAGTNNLKVAISQVNNNANSEADSVVNSSFTMASAVVQRSGLIEEFSSSTCNPCMAFNYSWDPLMGTLNVNNPSTHVNELKYQMNWPDWDNDKSYNADGNDRRGFYGVNSIPMHFVNGVPDGYGWSYPFTAGDKSYYTNQVQGSDTDKAYVDMTTTYSVDTNSKLLSVSVTVTPHFTVTGGTFHVYIAAADQHYQNIGNEWGQLDYYHVERMMFPNGNGNAVTSWTDGVAQTFTFNNVPYTNTNWNLVTANHSDSATQYPKMNSKTFWSNPLTGSELVAFVEEDKDGSILQSIVAPASAATLAVSTLSNVSGISIYPNPTKNAANLQFDLTQASNVDVKVIDYTGRLISNVVNQNMNVGKQTVSINTENLVPGNYIVTITTNGGTNAERLTVLK